MVKKSIAQISNETNGKRVRGIEAKAGAVVIRFADDSEMVLSSEKPIAVTYGETQEAEGEAQPVTRK